MSNAKKQLKYWNRRTEENHYCCSKYGFFFHNYDELRDFSNNSDYFSLEEEL
jgi:hypothetical protein